MQETRVDQDYWIDNINEDITTFERSTELENWPWTMENIYLYPSPPNGWYHKRWWYWCIPDCPLPTSWSDSPSCQLSIHEGICQYSLISFSSLISLQTLETTIVVQPFPCEIFVLSYWPITPQVFYFPNVIFSHVLVVLFKSVSFIRHTEFQRFVCMYVGMIVYCVCNCVCISILTIASFKYRTKALIAFLWDKGMIRFLCIHSDRG